MASSQFWQERANTFMQITGHQILRADGHYVVKSGEPWQWRLTGGAGSFTRETFENLARSSAFEVAAPGATDLLVAWLEEIRKEGINFRSDMIAYDVNEDGSRGTQYVAGTITAVCEASAILCRRLANRALQEQFEAKQRDDPRNWSQLRQSFEAFRAIKQLQALEPERIPESLVRESIAREQGIPPEQVTAKQIRLEVAGLLPFYPHIELVPPPSRNMAANGNDARGRRELRDSYLSQFPEEKLKIRDICWAAGQHYREWKRWLAGQLKDGSTGDVAFRRVLTSGKRPQELKKQPRPKAWQ